jgi:CubicO group peptidase (beta-lactamase class C family)
MNRVTANVRRLYLFLGIVVGVSAIAAQSATAQVPVQTGGLGASDSRFDAARAKILLLMEKDELPSVAVAVAQHGKIIWEQGFGYADREQLQPATSDTMYSLASISKPFTATAVMELVQKGKIRLDAPANDYLGAAKLTGLAGDASGADIRHILSHTSGLPLHWQFFYANEDYRDPPMEDTILRYGVLVNPPGELFQYSNLGFGILGHIVSLVSGLSYPDAMQKIVFAPLGLTHTSSGSAPGLDRYAAPRYDSKMRPLPFYTFDHLGASAIYSSAHDLVRFAMFHLKDHLAGQEPILDDATIDLMHKGITEMSPNGQFYALGFFGGDNDHGVRVFGHSGGMPGVSTVMRIYPEEDLAVVVFTNTSPTITYGGISAVPQIEREIASSLIPRYAKALAAESKPPETPKVLYHPTPELLGTWAGTLRTWQGTTPLQLDFQPDGDIHVKLGDQLETLLDGAQWEGKMLDGHFAATIPTPDAGQHRHTVHLELWQRNGKLTGEANAEATEEPAHYSLASFVELTRTTH